MNPITNERLEKLIQYVNLKHIVRTYTLTIKQIKQFIITHPMESDDDDVDILLLCACQTHLDEDNIIMTFKST